MAKKFTQSTYERHMKDEDYTNKAIDSLVRMNHGENATFEIVGDKVIVNGSSVLSYKDIAIKAIDRQADLKERPELESVYKSRQQRTEQAERQGSVNLIEKSSDEMMAEQAHKQMLSNAGRRTLASQQTGVSDYTSRKTSLPSDNN